MLTATTFDDDASVRRVQAAAAARTFKVRGRPRLATMLLVPASQQVWRCAQCGVTEVEFSNQVVISAGVIGDDPGAA